MSVDPTFEFLKRVDKVNVTLHECSPPFYVPLEDKDLSNYMDSFKYNVYHINRKYGLRSLL